MAINKATQGFWTGAGAGARTVTVKTEGLKELLKALETLPGETGKKFIAKGLKEGGEIIRKAAKSNIHSQRNESGQFGTLANSITIRPDRKDPLLNVQIGPMLKQLKYGSKMVKPFYGHMIEWGTKGHWIPQKGKGGERTKALLISGSGHPIYEVFVRGFTGQRPFTRAVDNNRESFLKRFRESIDKSLEIHFKKWLKQNYGITGNING